MMQLRPSHKKRDYSSNRNTPPFLQKTPNLGDPQGSQLKPHRSQPPAKVSKCKRFTNCGNSVELPAVVDPQAMALVKGRKMDFPEIKENTKKIEN